MARFGAPHGIRGALRLRVFSRNPSFFAALSHWWCRRANGEEWRQFAVRECRQANDHWLTTLDGIDDRTAAERWRNGDAAVTRADLPQTEEDEFYWCDLVGLRVLTGDGDDIGVVTGVWDIGAHDVLKVRGDGKKETLIPFVSAHIQDVSLAEGIVRVNWQRDW